MTIAAYAAVGFAVAAIHAFMLLRDPRNPFHRRAFAIALSLGAIMAVLQPLSGDFLARQVFHYQPAKLAAMEGQFKTQTRAPLHIGGWPDEETQTMKYGIAIPAGLSLLVYHNPNGEIKGLEAFPRDQWPSVAVVHLSFQIMVACGMFMMLTGLVGAWLALRKKKPCDKRWFLWLTMLCGPLGFVAIETGWTVTEVGRQPWIMFNGNHAHRGSRHADAADLDCHPSVHRIHGALYLFGVRGDFPFETAGVSKPKIFR